MRDRTLRVGLLAATAALALAAGCVPSTPSPQPALQPPLAGSEWVLESMAEPGSMQPALVGRDVTLAFIDEQKLGGNASCNSYFGQYTSTLDGTLSVSGLGSTKMYCTEPGVMAQEQSFLNALAAAESYEVAEGKLHITGGGRLLVLTPD